MKKSNKTVSDIVQEFNIPCQKLGGTFKVSGVMLEMYFRGIVERWLEETRKRKSGK